jgi:flagellar basal-body rod modification protein FlgD
MATNFDSTLASLGIGRTDAATTAAAATNSTGTSNMTQNDFLTLMTEQLKNQDPFAPVDNTQMVAQMAQFSSLAGISQMNTTLQAISDRLGAPTTSDAMSWVGKNVLTAGNTAYPNTDGTMNGAINLGADATDVTVSIEDSTGKTMKTVSLGPQSKGVIDYQWDGSTDDGSPAGAGPFKVSATARNADGGAVTATPLVWAPVTSVTPSSTGDTLLTLPGIGQVSTSNVLEIG